MTAGPVEPVGPADPVEAEVRVEPAVPLRRRAVRVLRPLFAVVAAVLLALALHSQWDGFTAAVVRISPARLLGAGALGAVALVANALAWRSAMASVGAPLPLRPALRAFCLSQLGKYVPGSVWPVLAQTELARDHGHTRARGATGSLLAMVVGVVTSSAVAAAALALRPSDLATYWWVWPFVAAAVTLLLPPVLTRVVRAAARLLRRSTPVPEVAGRHVAAAVGWSLVMWAAFGLHTVLVAGAFVDVSTTDAVTLTGGFALAWLVGFLVVVAPAGVGAREAALVVALGGLLSRPDALALALVSRVLLTVVDAVAALAVSPAARSLARRARRRPPAA